MTPPVAPTLLGVLDRVLDRVFAGEPPLRQRGWDGNEAGPPDAPCGVLRSPAALRRLLFAPGELGLARAYVADAIAIDIDIDIDGDLADGLRRVPAALRARGRTPAAR